MRIYVIPAALVVGLLSGCAKSDDKAAPTTEPAAMAAAPAPAPGSPEAKIAEAMSAAPKSIADQAAIMDWPATEGGQMTQLRAGTNGWTCFPSSPAAVTAADKDPMCLDESWLAFAEAWTTHATPKFTHAGIGYMLQGGSSASNSDPSITEPPAGRQRTCFSISFARAKSRSVMPPEACVFSLTHTFPQVTSRSGWW